MGTPARAVERRHRGVRVRELEVIQSAIDLVASGGSQRVTVVGLWYGEQLVPEVEVVARERRVDLRLLSSHVSAGKSVVIAPSGG